jgi:8-oxo-dGTP diphosphatase
MRKQVAKIILLRGNTTLLQHRDNKPNVDYPDMWSLLGGQIEVHESPLEAIKREIKEEIGIDLTNPKLINVQTRCEGEVKVIDYIFLDSIDRSISNIVLAEGQEVKYFDLEAIESIKIVPHFKDLVISELHRVQKTREIIQNKAGTT